MKLHSLPATLFLLALGACAADIGSGPVDPGNNGSNDNPDGSGAVPLSPQGRYTLQSDFDIASNMPGTAGDVINGFIQATDDPDDPTRYILDQLIAQLPNGTFKNVVSGSAPFIAGYLNDRLLDVAPDFVTTIVDTGNKFGQVARHFGTIETLDVSANGQATHTLVGLHFKVDDIELDYMLKDYNLPEVAVPGITVQLDKTGRLSISEHSLAMSYGAAMRLAVDQAIIPLIDPTAQNLSDLLHNHVNCQAVGQYVYEAVGIGSPSTFQSACNTGLTVAADQIYHQIGKIDSSALQFGLTGVAKGIDKNHDGKMDVIQTGAWSGTLTYASSPAPLAKATFIGARAEGSPN